MGKPPWAGPRAARCYFFLPSPDGVCANALAAAAFSAFVALGSDRTFPAAEAAFFPVCFRFVAIRFTSLRAVLRRSSERGVMQVLTRAGHHVLTAPSAQPLRPGVRH